MSSDVRIAEEEPASGSGRPGRLAAGLRSVRRAGQAAADRGTVTAEYAVATLGACGFAGLLLGILRSGDMKTLLLGIVKRGLNLG